LNQTKVIMGSVGFEPTTCGHLHRNNVNCGSEEQLQIMSDISTKTIQSIVDGQTPTDLEALNTAGLNFLVRGKLAPDTKNKNIGYRLSEKCFNEAMSLLIPRITTKDKTPRLKM
jgi:hypothetical protein